MLTTLKMNYKNTKRGRRKKKNEDKETKISEERYKDTRKNKRKKDTMGERYDSRKRKTATNEDREQEGGNKLCSEMEQKWRTW
jgi:hypothetical protein